MDGSVTVFFNSGSQQDTPADKQGVEPQSQEKTKGLGAGGKAAVNVGIQVARQVANKSISEIGTLYGKSQLQENLSSAINMATYAYQIGMTGGVGVAMVGLELGIKAYTANVKINQEMNKIDYNVSMLGYVATGAGRYTG